MSETARNTIRDPDDFSGDHAGTHRSTAGDHARVDPQLTAEDKAALDRDGYVVLVDLIGPDDLERMRAAVPPLLTHTGRNDLEGTRTRRAYSVPAKTDTCNVLAEHPRIQCLLDECLLPNYLLSMFQVIQIDPGEKQQILHHDDAFYPIPRPRPPVSIASILAVDDFTADNGATVFVPGSHRWGDRRPGPKDAVQPIVMAAGSVVVFAGTLWHGGGANRSAAPRLAVTCQYCEPWARTQENMYLAVNRETVRDLSPSMQRLLGYSIHAPFMGNVNGTSPLRTLE